MSKHLQQSPAPSPPPVSGKSQGPAHGVGVGVGLYLLSLGGSPGQKGGGASRPTFTAGATTPRPGGNVGSLAVNLPTYVANQFVLVNLCGAFLTSTDTASAPGWTADGVVASGQRILFGFHRKMDGSEGSTVTFTFSTAFERPFAATATYTNVSGVEASKPTNLENPTGTWHCGPITTTGSNRTVAAFSFVEAGGAGGFGNVTSPGGARVNYLDPVFGNEAALIADLSAPAAGGYSMSGAIVSSGATAHSILIGLF